MITFDSTQREFIFFIKSIGTLKTGLCSSISELIELFDACLMGSLDMAFDFDFYFDFELFFEF